MPKIVYNPREEWRDVKDGKTEYFVCVPHVVIHPYDVRDPKDGFHLENVILSGPFDDEEKAEYSRAAVQGSGVNARLIKCEDLD